MRRSRPVFDKSGKLIFRTYSLRPSMIVAFEIISFVKDACYPGPGILHKVSQGSLD